MAKRKGPKPPRIEYKIRLNHVGPLLKNLPITAQFIINGIMGLGKNRCHLCFALNKLPPTVNNMYNHSRYGTRLTEEAKEFRVSVALAIGHQRLHYKCGGTAAVLIFLESPNWVTQKLTIREWDADNRIKPLLDAVKIWINVPDETNWELHVWKVASTQTRTTCYLFDLGDLINFHT